MSTPRASARHEVLAMTRSGIVVHRAIRILLHLWCRVFWRMEVRGLDRLPLAGAYILAPVHRSNVDTVILGGAIPNRLILRFMAKDSLWKVAWFGKFLESMGSFPVNRDNPDRGALRNSEEALAHGDQLVMYPEGRRMEGDVVVEMHQGPAWLACRLRVPVVPIGLGNTDAAMPIGAKSIRPVKVTVVIGEPLLPDVAPSGRVPRGSVEAFSEQIRESVQRCYDEARGS